MQMGRCPLDASGTPAAAEHLRPLIRRVWCFFAWPSAVLTLIFGSAIMHVWLASPWFHAKLSLVFGLLVCHFICHRKYRQFQKEPDLQAAYSRGLRALSEVMNVLLFSLVSLAVLKDFNRFSWLLLIVFLLGFFIFISIRLYKWMR